MTVGTLKALVERCAWHLKPVETHIREHLLKTDVLHADETGLYVMGKYFWTHAAAALTHYAAHAKGES
jgi:hypothetical protein